MRWMVTIWQIYCLHLSMSLETHCFHYLTSGSYSWFLSSHHLVFIYILINSIMFWIVNCYEIADLSNHANKLGIIIKSKYLRCFLFLNHLLILTWVQLETSIFKYTPAWLNFNEFCRILTSFFSCYAGPDCRLKAFGQNST